MDNIPIHFLPILVVSAYCYLVVNGLPLKLSFEHLISPFNYYQYKIADLFVLIVMIISIVSFSDQLNCFCEIC
jgi:hypothetical protein